MIRVGFPTRPDLLQTFGFFAGIALAAPLFGAIGGIPSFAFGLAAWLAAMGIWPLTLKEQLAVRPVALLVVVLGTLYCALVIGTASGRQFEFLIDLPRWRSHSQNYYDAALWRFLLYAIPGLTVAGCFAFSRGTRSATKGAALGILIVALLGIGRVTMDSGIFLNYGWREVRPFFAGEARGAYSLVSYGMLMVMGAGAALALGRTWLLAGLFLFFAFWLNRRAETMIITLMIVGYFGLMSLRSQWRPQLMRASAALSLALFLALPLHHEGNVYAWRSLWSSGVEVRLGLASDAVAPEYEKADLFGTEGRRLPLERGEIQDQNTALETSLHDTSNRGLGSYALRGGYHYYPHNILVQSWIELGAAPTLMLVAMVLLSAGVAGWAILAGRIDPIWLALSGVAVGLFLVSLKAGDLTSFGRLVPLLTVAALPCGLLHYPRLARQTA